VYKRQVGSITKGASEKIATTAQEANALVEDYRGEDDDYLKRKFKGNNMAQKIAASRVLKERGYGNQNP
jgi:hypothetical protein